MKTKEQNKEIVIKELKNLLVAIENDIIEIVMFKHNYSSAEEKFKGIRNEIPEVIFQYEFLVKDKLLKSTKL